MGSQGPESSGSMVVHVSVTTVPKSDAAGVYDVVGALVLAILPLPVLDHEPGVFDSTEISTGRLLHAVNGPSMVASAGSLRTTSVSTVAGKHGPEPSGSTVVHEI